MPALCWLVEREPRYVDDPETSDDDSWPATKKKRKKKKGGREGEKQQREEAETSTRVYKAVSSVSLSRLSRNENVRPARILIPRTEPPPPPPTAGGGPRATPFFFASPMSPSLVACLLFLTASPTPALR